MRASELARTYTRVLNRGAKTNAWAVVRWCKDFTCDRYRPMGPIGYEPGGIPGITAFHEHGLIIMFEQRLQASQLATKLDRGTEGLIVHRVQPLDDLRFDVICESPTLSSKENVPYYEALRIFVASREIYPSSQVVIAMHQNDERRTQCWVA